MQAAGRVLGRGSVAVTMHAGRVRARGRALPGCVVRWGSTAPGCAARRGLSTAPTEAVSARVQRLLATTPQYYTETQRAVRSFWAARTSMYASVEEGSITAKWSARQMLSNMWNRKEPLRVSALHLVYSAGLTVPFCWVHSAHPGLELGQLEYLVHRSHEAVEYLVSNSDLLYHCTGFMATALFLMLSFRLNRAMARWWRAREVLAEVHGDVHSIVHAARQYVTDKRVSTEVAIMAFAQSRAIELEVRHCTDEVVRNTFEPFVSPQDLESLVAAPNRPLWFGSKITTELEQAFDQGKIRGIRALVALQAHVLAQNTRIEKLIMLQATPEPWSYQKHLRFTIQLWLGLVPLTLLPSLLWATPALSTAISYVVFKLDDISMELQNPFGYDMSDLSICLLNDKLQLEVLHTLLEYAGVAEVEEPVPQSVIDEGPDRCGLPNPKDG